MYKQYAVKCPTYENVDGLLKGLKMTEEKFTVEQLLSYIQEDRKTITRLIKLHDRTMGVIESHQDRITRLEYALARKEKKVSRFPGDRES